MKEKKWSLSDVLLIAGVTVLSIIMRYVVKNHVSMDWVIFWEPWFRELEAGGFSALAGSWYDYAPPWVYCLYLISILPVNPMTGFKVLVTGIDFCTAIVAYRLVCELTKNHTKSVIAYAFFMICPVYIANSVQWAQCDMLPMLWILLSMYYFVKERPSMAMSFFGIAFAFKLQPLWLAPLLLILWVNKKVELKHFLWLPFWYIIGIIPACIAGKPVMEALTIYFSQTTLELYTLALKYPNVYYLIGTDWFLMEYHYAGMLLALSVFMVVLYYIGRKKLKITKEFIFLFGAFVGMLAPFLLPHMHERYSFFGETFLLFYVFMKPEKFYLLFLQMMASFMGYAMYLSRDFTLPLAAMAFVTLFVLVKLGLEVYAYVNAPENQETALEVNADVG
ncbi:MAG: hypothetical protein ACI4DV_01695 [Lachnospiraceae bacterium]